MSDIYALFWAKLKILKAMRLHRLCQLSPIPQSTSKPQLNFGSNLFGYCCIPMIYITPIYSQLRRRELLANNLDLITFY